MLCFLVRTFCIAVFCQDSVLCCAFIFYDVIMRYNKRSKSDYRMYYLLLECFWAMIVFFAYRMLLRALPEKKNYQTSWLQALWGVLLALLSYTWLFVAVVIIPWESAFVSVLMFLHGMPRSDAALILANDLSNVWQYTSIFFTAGYTIIFGWFLLVLVHKWEQNFALAHEQLSAEFHSAVDTLFLLVRGAIYLVLSFVLMRVLNLNHLADSLFTTGAVGALFVSIAARDSIANIFGGFMILFDKPFRVGDYILSPDRDIEGTVEQIGWRMIQVRTPKKTVKYIPNCLFSTVSIENITRMSNRRIQLFIALRYDDLEKIKAICAQLERVVAQFSFIDQRMSNFCTFHALGEYSVEILLNCYTKPLSFREYNKSKDIVLHEVVTVVKANEADFPFPTTTLDMRTVQVLQVSSDLNAVTEQK